MIKSIKHKVANWEITITDQGVLNKKNPNKLDYESLSKTCLFKGCKDTIRINRTSGLCNKHEYHQHDLLLELKNPNGKNQKVPAHQEIIDCLIEWATSRNFNLTRFFEKISFSIIGNVPDVTSLANEVDYKGIIVPSLEDTFITSIAVAEDFFPKNNNSSYQTLTTRTGEIPIIVLAHIFIGLIVCEEANRGDRWHCRVVRGSEKKTTQLGGIMPIAYYAARTFNWGIELGKSAKLLTR